MITSLFSPADTAHEPSGADIWNAIVQAAIGAYRTRPFHEVTLDVVAAMSGLSLDRVLERFATVDDLMIATMQVWNAERLASAVPIAERHGAVPFLRDLVRTNVEDLSLVRLITAVISVTAAPDHPMAQVMQRQWVQFHALVTRALAHDADLGRESRTIDPSVAAEQLIAMFDGLQLQAMTRPGSDPLLSYDRAVAQLRAGWSQHPALVWAI